MGADAAVGRHDGTPPREDQIADRMRAEGLSLQGWGNGPCDTYGWHEQGYERCCTACAAGSCSTPPAATSNSARETRWSSRRTPRTRQPSARRACAASERPDSQTRARLTGSATWQTCSMSCRGPGRPSSRQMSAFFGRGRRIFIHTRLPPAASNGMAAPRPDSREAKTRRPVTAISSASPVPVPSWPWPRLQSRPVARSRNLASAGAQRHTDGQRRQDNQVGSYGVVPWKWGTP